MGVAPAGLAEISSVAVEVSTAGVAVSTRATPATPAGEEGTPASGVTVSVSKTGTLTSGVNVAVAGVRPGDVDVLVVVGGATRPISIAVAAGDGT